MRWLGLYLYDFWQGGQLSLFALSADQSAEVLALLGNLEAQEVILHVTLGYLFDQFYLPDFVKGRPR